MLRLVAGLSFGALCKAAYDTVGVSSGFVRVSTDGAPTRPDSGAGFAHCYRSIEGGHMMRVGKRDTFSKIYEPYTLGEVIPITHDVALFRFLLHDPDDEFNLKPCSTLQGCYKYGVQSVEQCHRFYTPVTANHTKGYFDIIVKRKNGGLMTSHLFGMHVGDQMLWRQVAFKIQYKPNRWDHVGMICGGTGFTPMLQVIRHALTEPMNNKVVDKTKLTLLFCNRTEKHILLKGLFDKLARDYSDRFKVWYCVDAPLEPKKWTGFTGYVTKEMVMTSMPPPEAPRKIIMLCGPDHLLHHVAGTPMTSMHQMSSGTRSIQPVAPDMCNLSSLGGVLKECGYANADIFRF